MTKNILLLTVTLFCFACASSTSESTDSADSSKENNTNTTKENVAPINSTHIDIFGSCDTYDNRLSSVASEIKFVKLDDSQLFNNFHVGDIALSDKYIFLQLINSINKYDRDGNFISKIGKQGRGPKQFLQLSSPMNIDYEKELLYATDGKISKMFVYNFDGTLNKIIKQKTNFHNVDLITPQLLASRQTVYDRQSPNSYLVQFYDLKGNIVKTYPSNLYPIPNKRKDKHFGATSNMVWEYDNKYYMLEFGSDTIFQFLNDSLIFSCTIGGKYRLKKDEYFKKYKDQNPKSLEIYNGLLRLDNGIFESDTFLIFKLDSGSKSYLKIYNKRNGAFHQTKHKDIDPSSKFQNHEFFTDDIVSGLKFNPSYQSLGKAIGFVSALELFDKKDEVLEFIKNHPSDESSKLKAMIDNLDPDGGDFLMIVKFK